jgi:hypothetical protein
MKEDIMKKIISCAAAAMLLTSAGTSMAGEITGPPPPTNQNPAPGTTISNGNSLCSFSGLNDTPQGFPPAGDPGGIAQSYGYFMAQYGLYDSSDPEQRDSFLFPAQGCNPHRSGGTH